MRGSLLVSLLLIASCGGDDGPADEARWQLLGEQRPSSLLAVWASSIDNVWIVGGREGTGGAPTVFHFDGTAWSKPDTGLTNVDLWQVFGFDDGTVFLGGSNGTILRYRDGSFTKLPTPTTDIVFGLWGSASTDVWAVGGQTTGRGFVWRLDGDAFVAVPGLPTELETGTVWKVSGRAADDVWMSGSKSLVMHWDGATLSPDHIGGSGESLFSIGCNGARCWTAGTNSATGVLYQDDGAGWVSRVPTLDGPVWRGVTPVGEHPYAVGMAGAVVRFENGTWVPDAHGLTTKPLHAAWADAEGNLFAVGGNFDRAITTEGVVLFKGAATLPALP